MQECEALIWRKKGWLKPKYVVEAELRAFGELELFKSVRVSIYPYEGTSDDLSENQRRLLDHAYTQCTKCISEPSDFGWFCWVIDNYDTVRRISVSPKDDHHPLFEPLQKSQRAAYMRMRDLSKEGLIKASVLVMALSPLTSGLLSFFLEDKGRACVQAHQRIKLNEAGVREYGDIRYHLNDPEIFEEERESFIA